MKNLKKITLIIFAFIISFVFSVNVNAKTTAAIYYPAVEFSSTINGKYYLQNIVSIGMDQRDLKYMGLFELNIDGTKTHAYCIEPGVSVTGQVNYSNKTFSDFTNNYINNNTKKTLVSYILSFAYTNSPNKIVGNKTAISKVMAAQGLIWEVITGERTNFSSIKPNKMSTQYTSFYTAITKLSEKTIYNEYVNIINKIQKTYYINPAKGTKYEFKLSSNANVVPLTYNASTKKYTLTIKDPNFAYWKVSNEGGISASINKNANAITITSDVPIEASKPAVIELTTKINNKVGTPIAFYSGEDQDMVTVNGVVEKRYIKVYTPKYQLKITKTESLGNKPLSGVTFDLCSNNTCTKKITTLTTDANGVATYNAITAPGTYYYKETKTLPGYELDSKIYSIKVSASNLAGSTSFGTSTLKNNPKQFNLIKYTIDENGVAIKLNDGCGTDNYTGPLFQIKENNKPLYFKQLNNGIYILSSENDKTATTDLKTCNGAFKVYTLPNCNYTVNETKAPEGLTLPSNPSKKINVCGSDKNVSFTNGFTGLEFQKKNEDGEFISGGKFALQMKINNVYKDVLLKEKTEGSYEYDSSLNDDSNNATYILVTGKGDNTGIARISKLPPGEYRIVEKEAPEGYEIIKDKDSTAIVTIKDEKKDDYYLVELINQKVSTAGDEDSAELIVTIITGRDIPNYVLIISGLVILLVSLIIFRKKMKK